MLNVCLEMKCLEVLENFKWDGNLGNFFSVKWHGLGWVEILPTPSHIYMDCDWIWLEIQQERQLNVTSVNKFIVWWKHHMSLFVFFSMAYLQVYVVFLLEDCK